MFSLGVRRTARRTARAHRLRVCCSPAAARRARAPRARARTPPRRARHSLNGAPAPCSGAAKPRASFRRHCSAARGRRCRRPASASDSAAATPGGDRLPRLRPPPAETPPRQPQLPPTAEPPSWPCEPRASSQPPAARRGRRLPAHSARGSPEGGADSGTPSGAEGRVSRAESGGLNGAARKERRGGAASGRGGHGRRSRTLLPSEYFSACRARAPHRPSWKRSCSSMSGTRSIIVQADPLPS